MHQRSLWFTAVSLSLGGCTLDLIDDGPYRSHDSYETYPPPRRETASDNNSSFREARPGPVAAYGFDEGQGTTVSDASGNGITGELVGNVCWPEGTSDEGLHFDGGDGYVDLGNPEQLRIEESLTISAWIKATKFPWDDATIVSKRNGVEWGYQLDITRDLGERTIGFKLTTASGESMFRYGATPIETDGWYHVTGVYDADSRELHVYMDGELDDGELVGKVDSEQLNSEQHVTIGRRASAPEYPFEGYLDDVRIYDRALSAREILADADEAVTPARGAGRDVSAAW